MKRQRVVLLGFMSLLTLIILAGCSVMGDMHDTKQDFSAAYAVIDQLERGVAEGNSTLIEESFSEEGITIASERKEDTISRSEAVTLFEEIELGLNIIFDIKHPISSEHGGVVVTKGKLNPLLPIHTYEDIDDEGEGEAALKNSVLLADLMDADILNIEAKMTGENKSNEIAGIYEGTHFSIEYPDGWDTYKFSIFEPEAIISFSEDYFISLVSCSNNVFADTDMDTYIESLIARVEDYEENERLPRLDNISHSEKDISINGDSAVEVTFNYDYEFNPVVIEISLKLEGDSYYITKVELKTSQELDVVRFQERTAYLNENDDLYMVSFLGTRSSFDSVEANEIQKTFQVN